MYTAHTFSHLNLPVYYPIRGCVLQSLGEFRLGWQRSTYTAHMALLIPSLTLITLYTTITEVEFCKVWVSLD
jgi:hypothetical protein